MHAGKRLKTELNPYDKPPFFDSRELAIAFFAPAYTGPDAPKGCGIKPFPFMLYDLSSGAIWQLVLTKST
jgi:hypothetical protein